MPSAIRVMYTLMVIAAVLMLLAIVYGEVTQVRDYLFSKMPSQYATLSIVQQFQAVSSNDYVGTIFTLFGIFILLLAILFPIIIVRDYLRRDYY